MRRIWKGMLQLHARCNNDLVWWKSWKCWARGGEGHGCLSDGVHLLYEDATKPPLQRIKHGGFRALQAPWRTQILHCLITLVTSTSCSWMFANETMRTVRRFRAFTILKGHFLCVTDPEFANGLYCRLGLHHIMGKSTNQTLLLIKCCPLCPCWTIYAQHILSSLLKN